MRPSQEWALETPVFTCAMVRSPILHFPLQQRHAPHTHTLSLCTRSPLTSSARHVVSDLGTKPGIPPCRIRSIDPAHPTWRLRCRDGPGCVPVHGPFQPG